MRRTLPRSEAIFRRRAHDEFLRDFIPLVTNLTLYNEMEAPPENAQVLLDETRLVVPYSDGAAQDPLRMTEASPRCMLRSHSEHRKAYFPSIHAQQ